MQRRSQLRNFRAVILAALGLATAAYGAGFSLRENERQQNIGAGAGYFSDDSIVQMRATLEKIAADPETRVSGSSLRTIRGALADLPLNSKALALLGFSAGEGTRNQESHRRLMVVSDRVSRREPLSQLWLIEEGSASGDVRGAIEHYDAALSVHPQLREKLFPILASAIEYPEVRRELKILAKSVPQWMPGFIAIASTSSDLSGLVDLIASIPSESLNVRDYQLANANILFRLSSEGRKEDASRFAKRVMPGFNEKLFSEMAVLPTTLDERLGAMAWKLTDNEEVTAVQDSQGSVNVSVQPGSHGTVMTRHLSLTPARYNFTQTISRNGGPSPASLAWHAMCLLPTDEKLIWSQLVPVAEDAIQYRSQFDVPAECKLVRFDLIVIGPESQVPAEFIISHLSLTAL